MGRGRTQDCEECSKLLLGQRGIHSPSTPRLHLSVFGPFCLVPPSPLGQSQQRRPHLPFNPIWRCNVWVPEWKDHPGGPISQTSRWTLLHGPSNALWPIER